MHLDVNEESKILSIWMIDNKIEENEIPLEVNEIIQEYKNKKYKICFYKSGINDLKKDVLNLLLNNV